MYLYTRDYEGYVQHERRINSWSEEMEIMFGIRVVFITSQSLDLLHSRSKVLMAIARLPTRSTT
jgi:hypothetical protein